MQIRNKRKADGSGAKLYSMLWSNSKEIGMRGIIVAHRKSYYISYYSGQNGRFGKMLKRPYLLEPVIRLELTVNLPVLAPV